MKILCADIFNDSVTTNIPCEAFDAVLCWMTGSFPSHIGSVLNKDYRSFEGDEMATYRSKIQQRCYMIGAHALKPDGVVHIVDRLVISSWNDKDELRAELASMQSVLAGSSYKIDKADTLFKRLAKPFNTSRIRYIAPEGAQQARVTALASSRANKLCSQK